LYAAGSVVELGGDVLGLGPAGLEIEVARVTPQAARFHLGQRLDEPVAHLVGHLQPKLAARRMVPAVLVDRLHRIRPDRHRRRRDRRVQGLLGRDLTLLAEAEHPAELRLGEPQAD
jgi:hypothetical protein